MTKNEYAQETRARVGALLHNAGGTYLAAEKLAGIHRTRLSEWNRGVRLPYGKTMRKLRKATS